MIGAALTRARPTPTLIPRGRGGRRVLTFLLAEAELELMPPGLQRHPRVVARARKRRRAPEHLLLDQAQDHEAMRALEGRERRGRPDLAHVFLLLLQDSLLNRRGALRVLVHTRHDELVRVRADTRIMRSQTRFYQLAEDLLRQGEVPLGDPLLTLERGRDLRSVLARECPGTRVLLTEEGEMARTGDFTALARETEDVTLVFGGFPRGGFAGLTREDVDLTLRVTDEPVPLWTALVPVLAGLEDALVE